MRPRRLVLAGVVATLFIVAACGAPLPPAPAAAPAVATTAAATPPAVAATPAPAPAKPLPAMSAFKRGISFADWRAFNAPQSGMYAAPATDRSLETLATTGANWIALVVSCGQERASSTTIFCTQPRTATDEELARVVRLAHARGLRVMLKPQLDFSAEPNDRLFRGHIGTAFAQPSQWQDWFASYSQFITHYAAFARDAQVDMLVIGVELGGTTHRAEEWRAIARDVRAIYAGPLTYGALSSTGAPAPHGEEARITWWDAVDYIGVDAYYRMTDKNDPTLAELKDAWTKKGHLALLEGISRKYAKPVLFTEVGYRSGDGANREPGENKREVRVDVREQADLYQAALEVLLGQPWMGGIFWWQWFANPAIGGLEDNGFTPFGKPAEQVLKTFYSANP